VQVLVSGSTGLIGRALVPALEAAGHRVTRLVRPPLKPSEDSLLWDPPARGPESDALQEFDAVVHLAGENLGRRWTENQKTRIRASRVTGMALLAQALAAASIPPRALIAASAVGYYGDRGAELLSEESPPGAGFLAEVCRDWEAAAEPAAASGLRVVNLRFGLALARQGGALARMLPPFRIGLGGPIAGGRQYLSWIALDDLVRSILFALTQNSLRGPVNVTAPNPVTNAEFARTLAKVLRRPALFPLPALAVRLMFGEMGQELLLSSQRVEPARLVAAGFRFDFPDLEPALRHALKKH
jgi:uncharacterized protein (TIGR01777 family)